MQRGFANILIVLIVVIVTGVGGYLAYQQVNKKSFTPSPNQVACTQDAKLCPDGTSVGRVVPECEFSPCPLSPVASAKGDNDMTNWKTYTSETNKYTLKIPSEWIIDFNNAKENNDNLIFMYSGNFRVVGDTQVPHLSQGGQLEILVNPVKSYNDHVSLGRPDKIEYPNEGREIMVDGEKAMLWTTDKAYSIPAQMGYQLNTFHNGKGYTILMISVAPQNLLLDQILSTFKFLP